jgi:aminomethyltransferase
MGEIEIRGPRALAVCQELLVTDVARLATGQAQYSLLCNADGGIVDDVIVYRLAPERYYVCVNAAHSEDDFDWCASYNRGRAELINRSAQTALVALQGPRAETILQRLTPLDVSAIRRYWSAQGELAGIAGLVARTGYTGEDGFELFVPAEHAQRVWTGCLEAGQADGLVPVGLGARDTLRLEAGYMLYGQDMDSHISPFEAGLSRLVHFESGAFIGRSALLRHKERGVTKKADWTTDGRAGYSAVWISVGATRADGRPYHEWNPVSKLRGRDRPGIWTSGGGPGNGAAGRNPEPSGSCSGRETPFLSSEKGVEA